MFHVRCILILAVLFGLSCTVQKRKYQKGYFVGWTGHSPGKKENKLILENKATAKNTPTNNDRTLRQKTLPSDLAWSNVSSFTSRIEKNRSSGVNDSCDLIRMKDSSNRYGKVLEIRESFIRYKACDGKSEKVKRMSKLKIARIDYFNGTKEVIVYEKPVKQKKKRIEPLAFTSSFLGPISFGLSLMTILIILLGGQFIVLAIPAIFCVAAILTALLSLKRISRNPDKYRGKRQAKIGLTFGVLAFIALYAFLLAILGGYII